MAGRYLLDTHCLIWFQENNPKIPSEVMEVIQNPDNIILLSQISLFEISIKQTIGKLSNFYATIEEIYNQALNDDFTFLPIENQHLFNYNTIPLIDDHRDPFDPLLVAIAMTEDAVIITDEKLLKYPDFVKVLW